MKKYEELIFLKSLRGYGNSKILKLYKDQLINISGVLECANLVRSTDHSISETEIELAIQKTEDTLSIVRQDPSISILTLFDDTFPAQLKLLKNQMPLVLFARGDIDLLQKPNLAVIGTRKPSDWSRGVGYKMVIKTIEISERVIVSGLALGCDTVGHMAAVENNGKTIAVLPSGLNVITPASNRNLSERILNTGGCIISEYLPMEKVQRATYAKRDEIIAALSDATFIIECGIKSGTMITAKAAYRMGKKIGCYIAPKEKGAYEGNAYLIKDYSAMPVTDTPELIAFLDSLNTEPKQEKYEQISLFDS